MLEPLTNKPSHTPVFINEPRLSDLRTVLIKNGIQAEFIGQLNFFFRDTAFRDTSAV